MEILHILKIETNYYGMYMFKMCFEGFEESLCYDMKNGIPFSEKEIEFFKKFKIKIEYRSMVGANIYDDLFNFLELNKEKFYLFKSLQKIQRKDIKNYKYSGIFEDVNKDDSAIIHIYGCEYAYWKFSSKFESMLVKFFIKYSSWELEDEERDKYSKFLESSVIKVLQ